VNPNILIKMATLTHNT